MLIEIVRQSLYTRDIQTTSKPSKSADTLEAAMKVQGIV